MFLHLSREIHIQMSVRALRPPLAILPARKFCRICFLQERRWAYFVLREASIAGILQAARK